MSLMPAPPPALTKRVVLQHVRGKHAGLFQILGTTDKLNEDPNNPQPPPVYVPEVDFIDHKGAARLLRVRPRFLHYIEAPPNGMNAYGGTFHPEQR